MLHVAATSGSTRNIVELLQVEESARDISWLQESLQNAVELELATLPVYLTGLWSIQDPTTEAYTLVDSVIYEEMVHLGLTANMLKAIGGSPQFNAPAYPGCLPGGVRPDLTVYLAGLTPETVAMYMQIEMPEHPVALAADTFPTIGAFYDAIAAAFQTLSPPLSATGQQTAVLPVPNPGNGSPIMEKVAPLTTLTAVEAAITLIKDQGEGTSTSPDAPEFGGELAHYYRFGEIYHGKRLIQVDGQWEYAGDPVPFPTCYPVAQVPAEGYPGVQAVQDFDTHFTALLSDLTNAWKGDGSSQSLDQAIGEMFNLTKLAQPIVTTQLPSGEGNYGPDFKPV
jgi:Ferritin-like